jgi:hypothetical protein
MLRATAVILAPACFLETTSGFADFTDFNLDAVFFFVAFLRGIYGLP